MRGERCAADSHGDMIAEITDAHFEEEVAHVPCALLFSSPWCGVCTRVAALVESLSKKYDRVKFCKVDITRNIRKASELTILSIPTILFFKGGKVVDQVIGAVPKAALEQMIQRNL